MNDPIILVENVSKIFPFRYKRFSLRQEATAALASFRQSSRRVGNSDKFYALKDINLSINQGESVAIVGRNGSGKSTLLRILSRIMRPSSGYLEVNGQYTSLIGLGAGFINSMSGRENIYLNAAMHGMAPRKTDEVVDQIIEFAELGEFIDTPVQDYSTGMNARLGFSVAIHILADLIFLDEVLAVGDADFQQKCITRINELNNAEKTILFVSHSESAVKMVCNRAIWLHDGEMLMDGPIDEVMEAYRSHSSTLDSTSDGQ